MCAQENENDVINEQGNDSIIDVEKTAMLEYLSVMQQEYEFERNKKQSFESRSSIIITLIGAICIFAFDKISTNSIREMIGQPLTGEMILKMLFVLIFYGSLLYTFWKLYKVITVEQQEVFPLGIVDEEELTKEKVYGLSVIILTYKDIVKSHRIANNEKAKNLRKALWGIGTILLILTMYINL